MSKAANLSKGGVTGSRTITFQPTSLVKSILAEVMKATGKSKTDVVNESLEIAGPHLTRLNDAYLAKKTKISSEIASTLKESHDSRDGG